MQEDIEGCTEKGDRGSGQHHGGPDPAAPDSASLHSGTTYQSCRPMGIHAQPFFPSPCLHHRVSPASSGPAPPQTPIQPIGPLSAVSSAFLPLLAPGQQPLLSSKHPFLDLLAPASYCPLLGLSFTAKPLNQGRLQTHFPLPYLPPPSVWL